MKISDKALGYFTFFALIVLILCVVAGMWLVHRETSSRAVIDFDELGALSPEDPVTENGYEIGRVGTVEWLGDRSRVTVIFNEPLTLREGSSFRNAAFALMGGRRIELSRSRTGDVLPADHVFKGEFVPGITESLRFIESVREEALALQSIVCTLLAGTDSTPGFVEKFRESEKAVSDLLENLDATTRTGGKALQSLLGKANNAAETVEKTTNTADSIFHAVNARATESIRTANDVLENLSEGISKLDTTIRTLEASPAAEALLGGTELLDKAKNLVQKTEEWIQAINTKGIAVYDEKGEKVKLVQWKNLNIIGKTAREKAKERQKKSANTP